MKFKPYNEWVTEIQTNPIRLYNGTPSVTSILKILPDPPALKQYKDYNRESFNKMLKEKGALGTKLHNEIENTYRTKKLMKVSGFHSKSFLKFYSSEGKNREPIQLEQVVYGDGYAGTYDALMNINGEQYIVDWKSTGQRIYTDMLYKYKLQLSAYAKVLGITKGKIVFFYGKTVKYYIEDVHDLDKIYPDFEQVLNQFNQYYNAYKSTGGDSEIHYQPNGR